MKKQSKLKKGLAILLSLAMVVGLMSGVGTMKVSAEETSTTASKTIEILTGDPEGFSSETYSNLLDGDPGTKWCCSFTNPSYVIFKASQPIYVDGYSVWTANDTGSNSGRNPVAWTLSACNDYDETNKSGSWNVIHEVTEDTENGLPAANETEKSYSFEPTTEKYQYFKLNITSIKSGDTMQLGDFALTYSNCEHDWVNNDVVAPTCTKKGYTPQTCSVCKAVQKIDEKDALGHDYKEGKCTRCRAAELKQPAQNNDGVYQIGTAQELYWFAALVNGTLTDGTAQNVSANAVLIEDITVNTNVLDEDGNLASNANSFTSWTPIGNNSAVYKGTFDGQGHTISGLYYNGSEKSSVGFFGCITSGGGSVSNVGIVDSYISATYSNNFFEVGGVCGRIENDCTIRNCYYTGVVSVSSSGTYTYVGGVCGRIYLSASITNCYHTGPVRGSSSGTNTFVGGVCGTSRGSVTNCYHTGIVSGSGSGTDTYVGVVCGTTNGSVTNCYYETMEGISGGINGNDATGQAEGKDTGKFNSGEVAYLLSHGSTDGSVWGQDLSTANSYPVFDSVKKVYGNCQEGKLSYSNEDEGDVHSYTNGICECGEYEVPNLVDKNYQIGNMGNLYWFAGLINGDASICTGDVTQNTSANAVLTADITVNTGVLDADGKLASNTSSFTSWTPIGGFINSQHVQYTGTFDGKGHTISGLYFAGAIQRLGFFGYVGSGGSVSNVGIVDSYFSGGEFAGGVCGDNYGGRIANCYCAGSVSGNDGSNAGGVCGRIMSSGSTTNCYHTGSVSGTNAGGVCGYNSSGTITNCYHTGSVSGTNAGGVCGNYSNGTSTNCYYETMDSITGGIKGADVEGQAEGKESARFNSGEVAYQLSRGTDGSVWGQDLSTANSYPVLDPDKTKTVYQVGINVACDSQGAERTGYSNTNEPINVAHIDDDKDGKCDSCGTYMDGIGAKLAGYSLSLNGNIGVNFYMEFSEAIASNENAYMEFTLPNTAEKTKVYVTGTHEDGATATTSTLDDKTYYVFSCEVAAKEMTDEIQAQMIVGENEGTVYTYTVKDYADYILSHTETYGEKVVALVKAMLNYGAYSQTYFEYQTAKLANADLAEADKTLGDLTAEELITYKASVNKNEAVCTFASAYLTLKSETAVNVYVKLADGVSEENVTFKIDDREILKENLVKGTGTYEGYYILSVDNIQASALDDMHTFTVTTTGEQTASLSYGPMSYCYSVIGSETASDELKNVVKALYAFNQAAKSYAA